MCTPVPAHRGAPSRFGVSMLLCCVCMCVSLRAAGVGGRVRAHMTIDSLCLGHASDYIELHLFLWLLLFCWTLSQAGIVVFICGCIY